MKHFNSMDMMTRAGCTSRRGVRHWEELGLLGKVERTAGDTRQFTDDQLDKAKVIAAAQYGGWSLDEIKPMLAAYDIDYEVRDALLTRLEDQVRAAVRLGDQLPPTKAVRPVMSEVYDL